MLLVLSSTGSCSGIWCVDVDSIISNNIWSIGIQIRPLVQNKTHSLMISPFQYMDVRCNIDISKCYARYQVPGIQATFDISHYIMPKHVMNNSSIVCQFLHDILYFQWISFYTNVYNPYKDLYGIITPDDIPYNTQNHQGKYLIWWTRASFTNMVWLRL